MPYRTVLMILLVIVSAANLAAQDTDTLPTVAVGETLQLTLTAGEADRYLIDLEAGQSILLMTESQVAASVDIYNAEQQFRGGATTRADNQTGIARVVADSSGSHTIEIKSDDEMTGEMTVTITDVEAHAIEIGQRDSFDADQFEIFEITFDGQAGQDIVFESSSNLWRYTVERVGDDGSVQSLLYTGSNLDRVTGMHLDEDATYRMVMMRFEEPDQEAVTEYHVEIREAAHFTGEIAVGETIEDSAPDALFSYTLDLEQHQGVRVTFDSNGAQTYITDADDNLLAFFGHAAVPHEFTRMAMIAPATASYTLYAYNPSMGDLFRGDFTLSVEEMDVMTLTDQPVIVNLTMELDQFLLAEVEAGQHYQLTIINDEQPDATVGVHVYELGAETLLRDDSSDTETAIYTFEAQQDGMVGIQLAGFNSIDGPITVQLQAVDTQ